MLRLTALILIALPLPAAAADFTCRNTDAEIFCSAGKCAIEQQSFTPMELRRKGKTLSICAYSKCQEGKIRMERKHGNVEMLYAVARDGLSVIHDITERTAVIRWGGFSNVMRCT